MAKRPSVSEIIAAVRAAGPARPEEEAEAVDAAPPPIEPGASIEEASAAPEVSTTSPTPAAAPPPSPGRPLTLKEKLAAAKNRPAGAEPAAAAAAPEPAAGPVEETAAEPPAETAPPPAPVPTGRPLTLQEKLAAARGRPAGAAPSAGTKPPAPKAAPAAKGAPAATAASRALPPLEKMSDPRDLAEALRRTGAERKPKPAEPAAKPAAAKKPTPAKAVPPRPTREVAAARAVALEADWPDETRRGILEGVLASAATWQVIGWSTFVAGLGAFTAMLGRFMFPNVLAEPPSSIKVGLPSDFEPDMVNEDFKAEWGFWMVRSPSYDGVDKIYAIQTVCTHLGCPPNWLPSEQKFKCPCHGSGFYISGVNFEGPAPRPLERFRVVLADDGQILVDKSLKFQEELGQWTDPDSFIPV